MFHSFRRKLLIFAGSQFGILILSLILYRKISLLYYINISFVISSILLFGALLTFLIQTGFFDVIGKSFAALVHRRDEKIQFSEIRPLSELVTMDKKPMLQYGLATTAFMLIALMFYYA